MKHILSPNGYQLFEAEKNDIGYLKLVTKYRDDFKGLIDSISASTGGADKSEILNPSEDAKDAKKKAGTPEYKAAVERIMEPVKKDLMGLIDRMAVDNNMSQGKVILRLYDKMDSGLMNAMVKVSKPFAKSGMIDQGVLNGIIKILSEDPKLKAIKIPEKPGKELPKDDSEKPVEVNGGTLIGSVINTLIAKLGMVRAN